MAAEPSLSTKCLADAWAAEGGWVLALVVFVQTISNNHASKFQEFNETNKLIAGICWVVKVGFAIQNESFLFLFFPAGDPFSKRCHIPGRWFGTCFIFHNIWDNPSHWLSYFSRWLKPTKQIRHLDPGGEEFIGTFLLVFTVECNVSVGNPTFAGRWGVGNSEVLCSPNYRGLSNRRNPPTRAV